jgi:hypothetical protein
MKSMTLMVSLVLLSVPVGAQSPATRVVVRPELEVGTRVRVPPTDSLALAAVRRATMKACLTPDSSW